MRTLTLTSPYMRGPDVRKVQARLPGVAVDDTFGPATASAVAKWRWRTGFPQAIPALGPDGQRILLGLDPLPPAYRLRARLRAEKPAPVNAGAAAVEVMVGWARRGLTESPPRSNVVPELSRIAREQGLSAFYQRMEWPWCAFCAFLAALQVGGKTARLGLKQGAFNALYCPDILTQATAGRFGMHVVGASRAKRGDLVLFDFDGGVVDHVGRILGPPRANVVSTVEGNTSSGEFGSQNDGGGVYLRERPTRLVRAYIRET